MVLHLVPSSNFNAIMKNSIVEPKDKDVLCIRSGETNRHPGTLTYRSLIRMNEIAYCMSPDCNEKKRISASIVYTLRCDGWRFLSKDRDGTWYDIGDEYAIKKTSQALRENQPRVMKDWTEHKRLLAGVLRSIKELNKETHLKKTTTIKDDQALLYNQPETIRILGEQLIVLSRSPMLPPPPSSSLSSTFVASPTVGTGTFDSRNNPKHDSNLDNTTNVLGVSDSIPDTLTSERLQEKLTTSPKRVPTNLESCYDQCKRRKLETTSSRIENLSLLSDPLAFMVLPGSSPSFHPSSGEHGGILGLSYNIPPHRYINPYITTSDLLRLHQQHLTAFSSLAASVSMWDPFLLNRIALNAILSMNDRGNETEDHNRNDDRNTIELSVKKPCDERV